MRALATTLLLSCTLLAGAGGTGPALAQSPLNPLLPAPVPGDAPPPPDPRGTFTFSIENDMFGGSDRYYTNGFQFSWRSPSADLPEPLTWLNDRLDWMMGPGTLRWGVALGQSLYTPQDTETTQPSLRDRPYAAFLYGAVTLNRITERTSSTFELQLGVVGPSALGEFVQNNYHDLINVDQVNGWRTQLKDEPAINAIIERKLRLPLGEVAGLQMEAIPSVTLSLGNVATYAGAGGLLRIGQGLEADFGPPRIRPALAGSHWIQPRQDFGWYVFAGADGRAVARDIFLDGNTWRDSRSVDKRLLVGDFQAGVAVLWRGMRFAYTQVWRSEEFYGQQGTQSFGSISVSFRF
ncbi:lipid A deacylase LpxR family protein [Pseudoroseomonas cervicalis]|uniref:lipid A deacylase LpxR family protein n=1 Tax=Teichococcus cervicalis TaxID=204525 RepID=UPI0022F19C31|nr:lipid A deacylase LpxR family protein [Pseudoroseomonas cervicalis]WBV41537.1 lipid A deacylase LpxR family protein [Pseudoroseomonas cervicalis]